LTARTARCRTRWPETLNRVARRLEEEGAIETDAPAHYCYIVARYVFLEYLRQQQKSELSAQELRRVPSAQHADPFGVDEGKERRLECLDQCVGKLDGATRELIIRYYHGTSGPDRWHRRALA
jgi:DNA-directed RNA polymerase specialized sigma24 family protein